jgi:hypothetical protein
MSFTAYLFPSKERDMKLNTLLRTAGAMAVLLTAGAASAHDSKPEVKESYELSGFR